MTRYLSIEALREPGDVGELDDAGRVQMEFGVVAWKSPSTTFLDEVVGMLVTAGVGQAGVTIFGGGLVPLPREGSVLHLRETAGLAPAGIHNEAPAQWDRRPGIQVIAHGESYAAASVLAAAAYAALVNVRNAELSA